MQGTGRHMVERDVAIIGAGQAGLAAGYYLRRAGVDVELFEAAEEAGASWSRRWDSLRLFTPARFDALPGSPFPGDPWRYPTKDEVAEYVRNFAAESRLPVRYRSEVIRLEGEAGTFRLHLSTGETVHAARVVVATGAFGRPRIPSFAANLGAAVAQVHTDGYRNPDQLPPGPVLVVGDGNSGRQIALELAKAGRTVHLAEGSGRTRELPQRILGRDLFWWLTLTRVIHAPSDSFIGKRLRANEPVIGTSRRALRAGGVTFHPRALTATDGTVQFIDGRSIQPAVVLWATGYRHDDSWIAVSGAVDRVGTLLADDVATPARGLYSIGRPWQRDRGSALLGYVQRDARLLAERIAAAAS